MIYLTTSDPNGMIGSFYIASSSSANINLSATDLIRRTLIQSHAGQCNDRVDIILALIDANTTIVYYKLSIGMIGLETLENQPQLPRKTTENEQQNAMNVE